ncbi:MAG: DUF3097 family protein [Actinomycetes bacterium]
MSHDVTADHGRHDYAQQPVSTGMALLHRSSGIRGVLTKFTGALVVIADRNGGSHTFRNEPGAFAHLGETVTLVRRGSAPSAPATKTSAAGGVVAEHQVARVARAARLWVEGDHDARLVERVWGDELRDLGVVVEPLGGVDDLGAEVRRFGPAAGRQLAVLVDHLIDGTKESRLAASVSGPHVLVVGHPFVDIWQCVRPKSLGIDAWPDVPRGEDWKTGVCARIGWGAPVDGWRRVLAAVSTFADLEPDLCRAVEEALDFLVGDEVDGASS